MKANGSNKKATVNGKAANSQIDEFAADLIATLNKEQGSRIAYNLATDLDAPTHISRWVSTGSEGLDYIISNKRGCGLPVGRIIEIFGPPSIGKSHIATQIARATQDAGGIVVYMDTENATQIENLQALGVDISRRFVFCEPSSVEEAFQVAERTIMKAKASNKDIPITIIWDSVAASPPKAELIADYDKDLMGVKARALSKGMRKITQLIANEQVTFIALNQTRVAIGVMYGDPNVVPGGKAIPFHASVRIKLGAGEHIKTDDGRIIGIKVSAKTIKNKVSYPFREANFEIHFGRGIYEHEQLFDLLRVHCEKLEKKDPSTKGCVPAGNELLRISGTGGWKLIEAFDAKTMELKAEKKFHKAAFCDVMKDPTWHDRVFVMLDDALIIKRATEHEPKIDDESLVELEALANENNLDEALMGDLST